MPNYLLHWQAMLDFKALGCDTYDWWGIPEEPAPDHPWFGLYRFKTGFGGETVRYIGLYEQVLRPVPLKLERRLQQMKAKVRAPVHILPRMAREGTPSEQAPEQIPHAPMLPDRQTTA